MAEQSWDKLYEVMDLLGGDKKPLLDQIDFHHEVMEQKDGVGDTVYTITVLKGATIQVSFV